MKKNSRSIKKNKSEDKGKGVCDREKRKLGYMWKKNTHRNSPLSKLIKACTNGDVNRAR